MCGKNHVRYMSSIIVVVFIFIGLCGFALAASSSTLPVKSTSPSSKPTSSGPTSSKPVSGVKTGIIPAPVITSISPTQNREGYLVYLEGSNFGSVQGPSFVLFGPLKATEYIPWSDTSIECVVPRITGVTFPVTEPVTVTTAHGKSNVVSFTVLAPEPTVSNIVPPEWVSNSIVNVSITGTGFQKGATVTLGSHVEFSTAPDLPVSNAVVISSSHITGKVKIPGASVLGLMPYYTAYVSNPDGSSGEGGFFIVGRNPCGAGAISPIVGLGFVMGIITLAGTVRARRRC